MMGVVGDGFTLKNYFRKLMVHYGDHSDHGDGRATPTSTNASKRSLFQQWWPFMGVHLYFFLFTISSTCSCTPQAFLVNGFSIPALPQRAPRKDQLSKLKLSNNVNGSNSNSNNNNNNSNGATSIAYEEIYENVLCELESEKLYGNTPRLCELDSLANWMRRGKLNIAPKYQRGYVWKPDRASRLVVTVLCNRIVPAIVLHEKSKGIFDVVDGKQRLTTLLSFYLAGEDPDLHQKMAKVCTFDTLKKLDENYESLEGLTYNDLTQDRQYALASYTIPCTIIPYGTPKEEVFSCYEDINSGGEDLKAQQLRRAVYYGEYIEMLDKLVSDENFQCIRDPKSFRKGMYKLCPKESDRELILRAFAWSRNYRNYRRPMKSFLNEELQHYENMNATNPIRNKKEMEKLEEQFSFIMRVSRNIFSESDGAFRKWEKSAKSGKWGWSSSIVAPFWDACYLAFADLLFDFPTEPIYAQSKDDLQKAIQDLFESEKLDISGTVTVAKFMERKDIIYSTLKATLQANALKNAGRRTRNFKNVEALREELYVAQGGRCSICNSTIDKNRLHDGSYVHIDHIQPWSQGGNSTIQNAAVVHAACNMGKGAKVLQVLQEDN